MGRQDKQLSNGLVFNHTVHSARTGLTEGVGREHAAYVMDSAARQATAQTARTLRYDAARPPETDTITVLGGFLPLRRRNFLCLRASLFLFKRRVV